MTKLSEHYHVIVVGAGSGGLGAAYSAALACARVLLVERDPLAGGTFVNARVNSWEPAIGGTGLSERIFMRLRTRHQGWCLYPDVPELTAMASRPEGSKAASQAYALSLSAMGNHPPEYCLDPALPDMVPPIRFTRGCYGIFVEPRAYARAAAELCAETGCIDWLPRSTLTDVTLVGGNIHAITVNTPQGDRTFPATIFVDGTAEGILCQKAGCKQFAGEDPHSLFGEPHAPDAPSPHGVRGASLTFRVTTDRAQWIELPEAENLREAALEEDHWTVPTLDGWYRRFPNGDWAVRMQPTFTGEELVQLGAVSVRKEGLRRILLWWDLLQQRHPFFRDFGICEVATRLGRREGPRTLCRHMLSEKDITDGIDRQPHVDVAALADQPLNLHRPSEAHRGPPQAPYGIPLRCAMPLGVGNLLVVSRAAGFSHIAAASCRLSRTLMQFGQTAGTAASLAAQAGIAPAKVPWTDICDARTATGCVLDPDTVLERHARAMAATSPLPTYPADTP